MDSNGNGSISRGEAKSNATLTAEFDAVDNNHDGNLDRQELEVWTWGPLPARRRQPRESGAFPYPAHPAAAAEPSSSCPTTPDRARTTSASRPKPHARTNVVQRESVPISVHH